VLGASGVVTPCGCRYLVDESDFHRPIVPHDPRVVAAVLIVVLIIVLLRLVDRI
jgi:hypothetical protein